MAVHFAPMGIRVNAIAPGFFSTKQNAALLWNEDGTPTARTGKILAATPMNRFGEPEELDGTLLFLCDEAYSGFITGVNIPLTAASTHIQAFKNGQIRFFATRRCTTTQLSLQ